MLRVIACILTILLPIESIAQQDGRVDVAAVAPVGDGGIPPTRWDHKVKGAIWTRAALAALESHGSALYQKAPADIEQWCPTYPTAPESARRAFWVGFLSALAKHESTYRADAVGGGGRWFGLLQIVPATARAYGCRAQSGEALQNGPANLSCAIRIMATTVARDGVIASGFKGVAADWAPLRSPRKRSEMMAWTSKQTYCKPLSSTRPTARPATAITDVVAVQADITESQPDLANIRPRLRPVVERAAVQAPDGTVRPRQRPRRLAQSVAAR